MRWAAQTIHTQRSAHWLRKYVRDDQLHLLPAFWTRGDGGSIACSKATFDDPIVGTCKSSAYRRAAGRADRARTHRGASAKRPVCHAPAALIGTFALGMTVQAAAVAEAPTRSVWLGATYDLLVTSAFEPSSRHGVGASGSYEFHVSRTFNLGLPLAYRLYPGERVTQQLGYGVTLKHFFSQEWATTDGVYPFLGYGLLIQQSFVEGRSGSAASHDTRLGGGAFFRAEPIAWFVDVGAHYSRLHFFDRESETIPYLEVAVGAVFAF